MTLVQTCALFIYLNIFLCLFFFFQAEDGIRDYKVTGVQTCALPIWKIVFYLEYPASQLSSSSSETTNLNRRTALHLMWWRNICGQKIIIM